MKTILKTTLLSITALFLLNSCSDNDTILDTTKPEITIGKPTDHQEYELGGVINIEALLTDNLELGAYKINIHSAGDGHSHGDDDHQHRDAATTDTESWEFNDEGNITGREYILNKSIPIPVADIKEGHYHLGIYAIDKAGNQNQSFIEIVIGEDEHHEHNH